MDSKYPERAYGLVDFKELDLPPLGEQERINLAAQADGAKPVLDKILKEILAAQINKWTRGAWTEREMAFHNGGVNMADLILETLESLSAEHQKNLEPTPEVDPTSPPLSSGSELEII